MGNGFIPFSKLMSKGRDENHICAFRRDETEVTWKELKKDVGLVCGQLKYSQREYYVLACEDIYLFLVAFMALSQTAKHIVISPNLQPKKLSLVSSQCDGMILNNKEVLELIAADKECSAFHELNKEQIKITVHTSGSTGQTVPVTKSLSALEAEVAAFDQIWGTRIEGGVFVSSVAHYHTYALPFQLLWPLCSGEPILLEKISYPEDLLNYGGKYDLNFISSPAFLIRYSEVIQGPVDFLKFVTSAGASLPNSAAEKIAKALSEPIVEIYGSTETGAIAMRPCIEGKVWSCLPEVAIKKNNEGTLLVKSPYAGKEDYQEIADYVDLCNDESFVLKGRADRIVKVYEKRVSLTELENLCAELPWVRTAKAIVLKKDDRLGCVVELNQEGIDMLKQSGRRALIEELRKHLHRSFELVLLPRRWRFVEALPCNDMGKLLQNDLLGLFE